MNTNPYETSNATSRARRWSVRRYAAGAAIALLSACVVATPAAFLLLQNSNAAPIGVGIFDIEFNGQPISNDAVIACSLGLSAALVIATIGLVFLAIRNRYRNHQGVEGHAHFVENT